MKVAGAVFGALFLGLLIMFMLIGMAVMFLISVK